MTVKEQVINKAPQIWQLINASDKILTHLHERPDPDSVSSALSLKYVLEKMGKQVDVVTQVGHLLPQVDYLHDYSTIKEIDYSSYDFSSYDLFIMIDVSDFKRVTRDTDYSFHCPTLLIDHHEENTIKADIELVVPEAPATCELLYWLYKANDVSIETLLATYLFTGIWTDTIGMKTINASADTHQIVADLVKAGARHNEIIFRITSLTNNELKQVGHALSRIKTLGGGDLIIAYQYLTDVDGISHYEYTNASEVIKLRLSDSSDASIAVLLYETEGIANISFRANNQEKPYDISVVARALGGGGHKAAAGAKLSGKTLDEAEQLVLEKVKEIYPEIFGSSF
jgi:phosphoesterase RecJ-like protein